MGRAYARGSRALAECMRCGRRLPYLQLVEDGQIEGLNVCRECWDPKHPQETIPDVSDPQALDDPSPELSIPDDEGDAAPTTWIPT